MFGKVRLAHKRDIFASAAFGNEIARREAGSAFSSQSSTLCSARTKRRVGRLHWLQKNFSITFSKLSLIKHPSGRNKILACAFYDRRDVQDFLFPKAARVVVEWNQ